MSKSKFFLATIKRGDKIDEFWVETYFNQDNFVYLLQYNNATILKMRDEKELECKEPFDEILERISPKVKEYTLDLTTTFAKNLMIIIIGILFGITISKLLFIKN